MSSEGEKIKVLSAKALGLVAVALVAITLLLTAPLASLASARVEARAGDTVAIAGDDDCDVETDDAGTNGVEEDTLETEDDNGDVQTQDEGDDNADQTPDTGQTLDGDQLLQVEDGDNGVQQAQYGDDDEVADGDNDVQQVQDGDDEGDTVVARAGDTVAVASEDCDVETETGDGQDGDIDDDVTIEDDEEVEDSADQPDGDTSDTSDLDALFPDLSSDEDSSDGGTTAQDSARTQGDAEREGELDILRQLEANKPGEQFSREGSRLGVRPGALRLSNADWTLPKRSELEKIGKPRRFDRKPGAAMTLSIRALGLYDVPVANSKTDQAFDRGVIHVPDTAYPWDEGNQKNVFLAGHRLGDPKEENSRLIFYHLDELEPGNEIILKDRKGRSYTYRVKELFKVSSDDAWVADTLVGRDLLTLQTYSLPNLEERIVVRADRVRQDSDRPEQNSTRQPNSVRQQDSSRQQDSVRQQNSERQQDPVRQPNPDRKKKRR